jgi:hypothetical protein
MEGALRATTLSVRSERRPCRWTERDQASNVARVTARGEAGDVAGVTARGEAGDVAGVTGADRPSVFESVEEVFDAGGAAHESARNCRGGEEDGCVS